MRAGRGCGDLEAGPPGESSAGEGGGHKAGEQPGHAGALRATRVMEDVLRGTGARAESFRQVDDRVRFTFRRAHSACLVRKRWGPERT